MTSRLNGGRVGLAEREHGDDLRIYIMQCHIIVQSAVGIVIDGLCTEQR